MHGQAGRAVDLIALLADDLGRRTNVHHPVLDEVRAEGAARRSRGRILEHSDWRGEHPGMHRGLFLHRDRREQHDALGFMLLADAVEQRDVGAGLGHRREGADRHDHHRKPRGHDLHRQAGASDLGLGHRDGLGDFEKVPQRLHHPNELRLGLVHHDLPDMPVPHRQLEGEHADAGLLMDAGDRFLQPQDAEMREHVEGADDRMACERNLPRGGEEPEPVFGGGIGRREHEDSFREVHLPGDLLHLPGVQMARVRDHSHRIAPEHGVGEHIRLVELDGAPFGHAPPPKRLTLWDTPVIVNAANGYARMRRIIMMKPPPPKDVTFDQINRILEVTDALALDREWIEIPLSAASPGKIHKLPNGKIEIVVDAEMPFDEWLTAARQQLRHVAPQTPSDGSSVASPQGDPPLPTDAAPAPAKDESVAETTQVIAKAVRYVKAKRGGDLAAIILAGSAARDAMTSHSDVDLLVLVLGSDNRHELVRILSRIVEIRYLGISEAEEQVNKIGRLPIILRKARVLYELESAGSQLLQKAHVRFRQGPASLTIHEKIRLRATALHWLGKAEDQQGEPAIARHLLSIFLDEAMSAFYQLRGFWS